MHSKYWPRPATRMEINLRMKAFSNVVIVYEDLEMGKRASWVCHSLANELQAEDESPPADGNEMDQELWNFQVLDVAEIHEQAVRFAARADLIVISTHGYEELPFEVLSWIEGWLARRQNRPGSLVALFERRPPEAGPRVDIEDYLREVARRGGLEFQIHFCPAANGQPEPEFGAIPMQAARAGARV
jgi:hypothetical protein